MLLTFVAESYIETDKRLSVISKIIKTKMEQECGVGNRIWIKAKNMDLGMVQGFFFLLNDDELCCAAFYCAGKIIARYTPPPHRNKGYATQLLREAEKFVDHETFPLWVTSYERMSRINERAGWINMGACTSGVGKEPEYDWCPPSKVKLYKKLERNGGLCDENMFQMWLFRLIKEASNWDNLDKMKLRLK